MIEHPYIKYAVALLMEKYNYKNIYDITTNDIIKELEVCLYNFSLKFVGTLKRKTTISFEYSNKEPNWVKNKLENETNIVLSPHVISSDVRSLYKEIPTIIANLRTKASNKGDLKKAVFPIGGEYLRFSDRGSVGKSNAKLTNTEIALMAITTLTSQKPCSSKWVKKGNRKTLVNNCVIPDISIEATKGFIAIFSRIEKQKNEGLFNGKVLKEGNKNYVSRPQIYWGNYPNASKSSYLQSLSVLGYIGELIKEKEFSLRAQKVIDELEKNPVLIINPIEKSETATIMQFSHFIIEIAKSGSLSRIVDSLYYVRFYKYKGLKRTDSLLLYKQNGIEVDEKGNVLNLEYEKFDYYVSNFLTLFNHFTFNEFLSCRVEYPSEINTILTIYFLNMEHISKEIIDSAEAFGAWINRCSFIAAKNDSFPNKKWEDLAENEKQKIVEKKYKFLVELESSIFSSDNNRSMISNIITRVGRLSNTDVPQDATLFIKAVIEPSIDIRSAKNLIIAFSRIYSNDNNDDKRKSVVDDSNISNINTIDSTNL